MPNDLVRRADRRNYPIPVVVVDLSRPLGERSDVWVAAGAQIERLVRHRGEAVPQERAVLRPVALEGSRAVGRQRYQYGAAVLRIGFALLMLGIAAQLAQRGLTGRRQRLADEAAASPGSAGR